MARCDFLPAIQFSRSDVDPSSLALVNGRSILAAFPEASSSFFQVRVPAAVSLSREVPRGWEADSTHARRRVNEEMSRGIAFFSLPRDECRDASWRLSRLPCNRGEFGQMTTG